MRKDIREFMDKVEGRRVFLLGGGHSVEKYKHIEKLNSTKYPIFCINSSAKFIKSPVGVLWMDDTWVSKNFSWVDKLQCHKFQVRKNCTHAISKNVKAMCNSILLNSIADSGYSENIDNVCGNNSGGVAMNFLINCKVKQIILVGFDMAPDRYTKKTHFHNEYDVYVPETIYTNTFIPSINTFADKIELLRDKIINCTPDTHLTCFSKDSLDNYI